MNDETDNEEEPKLPEGSKSAKIARGALQAVGGAVPFAGGVLSAIAGAWSEGEQEKVNRFFEHWVRMLQDELKEKQETANSSNKCNAHPIVNLKGRSPPQTL